MPLACACGCRCGCARRMAFPRPWFFPVGVLRGVIYRAQRPPYQCPMDFIHYFERRRPPVLLADLSGRRLYVAGGEYRVTRSGIRG